MTVTIKDLAQMANTSTATVSRVLSNKPGVAEEKRRSILQLASKVGYTPNRIAQNLALQKSHVIGLIAADLRNPVYINFFRRVQRELEPRGYRVMISDSERDVVKERRNISLMREQRVEGLIIFPIHDWNMNSDVEHFLQLKLQRFPFVVVGRIDGYGFDCVTSEELATARTVTQHLLDLGHRRIAFVGASTTNRCVVERLNGVRQTLSEAGLKPVAEVPDDEDKYPERVRALLKGQDRPTALVCVSDTTALMMLRPIADAGLQIPRDVSLVAFGDNIWSRHLKPAMTTTSESDGEIARVALELLMRRIEDPGCTPQQTFLPARFVQRESTGPAK